MISIIKKRFPEAVSIKEKDAFIFYTADKEHIVTCKKIPYVGRSNGCMLETKNKRVFISHEDNPEYAYKNMEEWYIASPIYGKKFNAKYNVNVIPLMSERTFSGLGNLEETIRKNNKQYDFVFMGAINSGERVALRNFLEKTKLKKALFLDTTKHDKIDMAKYVELISRAKFGFCPRGVGHSSFRLYESLAVGTVPIVTGSKEYPYENDFDWDSFSVRGVYEDAPPNHNHAIQKKWRDKYSELFTKLTEKAYSIIETGKYEEYRKRGMTFYDRIYSKEYIYTKILDKLFAQEGI